MKSSGILLIVIYFYKEIYINITITFYADIKTSLNSLYKIPGLKILDFYINRLYSIIY